MSFFPNVASLRRRLPAPLLRPRTSTTEVPGVHGRTLPFPESFLFGAASASHQVEGDDVHSDWWRFEREPGRVRAFAEYGEAAMRKKSDHYARFDEDVTRMRELGLSAYRFSIDWSRIEPREGDFDHAAIERYGAMCETLRANGIAPCVTLFHWSSPDWIWDRAPESRSTGWYDPAIVGRFARFVAAIAPAITPHAHSVCTLNEPNVFVFGGFAEGVLCPGHANGDRGLFPVVTNLFRAHVAARRVLRAHRPDLPVGIANNCLLFEAETNRHPLEAVVAAFYEQGFTWTFMDAVASGEVRHVTREPGLLRERIDGLRDSVDFVGVNYYERVHVRVPRGFDVAKATIVHDLNDDRALWPRESHPRGLHDVLRTVHARYGLPILVTENGRTHPDDTERARYLEAHLAAVAKAIEDGARVDGYFWWSLLDNQEWANGFVPRLGLFEIDYATFERTKRGTADRYAAIVRSRAVRG